MKNNRSEKGFTLLEVLLVVGVSAIVLMGISQLTRSWINSETASGAGQHLERVAITTQKFVEAHWADPALTQTSNALAAGGLWNDLRDDLQEEGLLYGGQLRSPLGVPLQIGYVIDTSGPNPIYRASIFSTDTLPNDRILDVARQTGNMGGTISTFTGASNAIGAFGQWNVATNRLLPGAAPLPCVITQLRGCLIAVVSYNTAALVGPYLYRDGDLGPLYNTMNTTLFMNNRDIVGAGTVSTNDLEVLDTANMGTTNINTANMNGPTTVSNGMNVAGTMNVTGNASFANNVTMNNGNLTVQQLNADTIQAPVIRTNNLDTQAMTVTNGPLVVDDSINVNGNVNVTGGSGQIFANEVNAGRIQTGTGEIVTGRMEVQNTMNITGTVNVNSTGDVVVDRLVADQCAMINDGAGGTKKYGICP